MNEEKTSDDVMDKSEPVPEKKEDSLQPLDCGDAKIAISVDDITPIEMIDNGTHWLIPSKLDPNIDENVIRILCISDTHSKHEKLESFIKDWPLCDILIHAGDITSAGNPNGFTNYNEWIKKLHALKTFKHAIVIGGNHDLHLDVNYNGIWQQSTKGAKKCDKFMRSDESVSKYLLNDSCQMFGIKFYGSPMTPQFGDWAFNRERGDELAKEWQTIPIDTQVLITHGPPYLHGDRVSCFADDGSDPNFDPNVGDKELLKRVMSINKESRIEFHIFGHIHEGYGVTRQKKIDTTFVNASSVDLHYNANHKPIMFYIKGDRNA